jgi:hypothetical protein
MPTRPSPGRNREASECETKTRPSPLIQGSTRSADAPSGETHAASA